MVRSRYSLIDFQTLWAGVKYSDNVDPCCKTSKYLSTLKFEKVKKSSARSFWKFVLLFLSNPLARKLHMHLCIEKCVSIWSWPFGENHWWLWHFWPRGRLNHKRFDAFSQSSEFLLCITNSILTNDMMSGFEYKIGPSHHGSFSREDFFAFI